jgi:hypothetical protein
VSLIIQSTTRKQVLFDYKLKILAVQSCYSLLSDSAYLSLLFSIITIYTEALVIMGHKVLYALFVEVDRQTDCVDQENHVRLVLGQARNFVG